MVLQCVSNIIRTSCRRISNLSRSPVIAPLQEAALEEKCIVVDDNDNAIGTASKRDCHRVQKDGSLILHRAFSVFLFNTKGEILLQERSPAKITFPGYVTNSCCSHPLHEIEHERNEQNALGVKLAAQRRLNYELGIPIEQTNVEDFHYLTRIHYQATDDNIWGEHEIDYILFLQKDVDLTPNSDEISDVKFVRQEDFDSFLANLKGPITPWFRLIVKNCLHDWWKNLDNLEKFKDHLNIQKFG